MWYKKDILQEIIFFIAMFTLTMLHEWIRVDTIVGFAQGLTFFLLLYGQAQLHRFYIFPLFLAKRFRLYTTYTLLATLTGTVCLFMINFFWICPEGYGNEGVDYTDFLYSFAINMVSTITIFSLFLMRQYSREVQRRNEAQLLLNEMNVKYLHAQLNPHFFFNMFNNLYGVSLTEPDRVPGLILKLSDLMRYQLENGNKSTVTLREEISHIENYIGIEKERVGKRCEIILEFPDNDPALHQYGIAPLLLVTLVENAFKHSLTIKERWFVHIVIEMRDGTLLVHARNSLPDEALVNGSTGIGLANTRERLNLLYKSKHRFSALTVGQEYHTDLMLQLNHY